MIETLSSPPRLKFNLLPNKITSHQKRTKNSTIPKTNHEFIFYIQHLQPSDLRQYSLYRSAWISFLTGAGGGTGTSSGAGGRFKASLERRKGTAKTSLLKRRVVAVWWSEDLYGFMG